MNYLYYAVFLFTFVAFRVAGELFDRYSGIKIHEQDFSRQCSIEVKPCTPYEGRRIDGTCNSYEHPSRGSANGPYIRLLKPDYGHMGGLRENKHGGPLPSARKVRTALQSTGRVVDKVTFNIAAAAFLELINVDISLVTGPLDYLRHRPYCCQPEGIMDHRCEPILIPHNDRLHHATSIRCMNYTRLETFQDLGCIPKDITPEQVNHQTPVLDLSTVYGVDDESLKSIRLFEHGLLKEEKRKNRKVPLNETDNVCFQNRGHHPICYKFGFPEAGNVYLPTTLMTIYFYREHNRLARELHQLNPCWKDDRLFKVARQINIATAANIFFYELLPVIMGQNNLIKLGLMSDRVELLMEYNESVDPLVYAEYELAIRFFQTMWDGRIKKYDEQYQFIDEFSYSDTFFRQELIEENMNFEELNRGLFHQNAAKIDDIQDPDISEKYYAELLHAHDRPASDVQSGRDFGLPGYIHYRQLCGLKPAQRFHDLLDVISAEKMEALMNLYQDIEDIDLLAGIMAENLIPGTFVGPTLYCIMARQFYVMRFSDRFWFERGKQHHSFNLPQLREIRKTNMARLACDNAEGIKRIQPRALLNVELGNKQTPCSRIRGIDLTKWYDATCHRYPRRYKHEAKKHYNFFNYFFGSKKY